MKRTIFNMMAIYIVRYLETVWVGNPILSGDDPLKGKSREHFDEFSQEGTL